jgi:hypothetical protein
MGANEQDPSWDKFFGSVERDLADLHRRFEHLYGPRRDRRMPSVHHVEPIAGHSHAPVPDDINDDARSREKMSNYRIFPRRENASARIFRPQNPERIARRNEQKTVPVVLGRLLLTDTE